MLRVNDLTKGFGSGSNRLEVLKGIDFEMKRGNWLPHGSFGLRQIYSVEYRRLMRTVAKLILIRGFTD